MVMAHKVHPAGRMSKKHKVSSIAVQQNEKCLFCSTTLLVAKLKMETIHASGSAHE